MRSSTATPTSSHPTISLLDLSLDAERLQHESRAANTHVAYATGVAKWNAFQAEYKSLEGKPATELSVLQWISWMTQRRLSTRTIRSYVTALRMALRDGRVSGDVQDILHSTKIQKALQGVRRIQGDGSTKERLPLTADIFADALQKFQRTSRGQSAYYEDVLLLAAMAAGLFGLMRVSEYLRTNDRQSEESRLTTQRITLFQGFPIGGEEEKTPSMTVEQLKGADQALCESIKVITISLRRAKNDQSMEGKTVHIANPLAIQLLTAYFRIRRVSNASPADRNCPFLLHNGCPYTSIAFNKQLKEFLLIGGVKNASRYVSHGLRRGGAQSLRNAGAQLTDISQAGRWRNPNTPYTEYIADDPANSIARSLRMTTRPSRPLPSSTHSSSTSSTPTALNMAQ
jgi:hypothetical protein